MMANKKTRVKKWEKRVKLIMATCSCNLDNNENSNRKLEMGVKSGISFAFLLCTDETFRITLCLLLSLNFFVAYPLSLISFTS